MPRRESIKTTVREMREALGVSQDELGKATGLGAKKILRLERGLYKPKGEEINKSLQALWYGELRQKRTGENTPTQETR